MWVHCTEIGSYIDIAHRAGLPLTPAEEAEHDQTELRCSFAAESRGDSQFATAAPASGYLLVEQPGAWGHQALTESGLDADVGARLAARAVAA